MSNENSVAIIGVGLHPFGRFDKTAMEMGAEAIQLLLADFLVLGSLAWQARKPMVLVISYSWKKRRLMTRLLMVDTMTTCQMATSSKLVGRVNMIPINLSYQSGNTNLQTVILSSTETIPILLWQ